MATFTRLTDCKSSDKKRRIGTMVHLDVRAFEEIGGEVVQSVAFVLEKGK